MKRFSPSLLVSKAILVAVTACTIAPAATSGQAGANGPVVAIGEATVTETNATGAVLSFPITVTNMSGTVTLVVATRSGTATPFADFIPQTAVFTLTNVGGMNRNYRFDVPIVGDGVPEGPETLTVSARIVAPGETVPASGAPGVAGVPDLAGEPIAATGTILDNDLVASGPGAAPAPSAPTSGASVAPATPLSAVAALPSTKRCLSRRSFTIRIKAPTDTTIVNAAVRFRGKTHETGSGIAVTAPVDLRGLPKGRFTVKVTVVLSDGRQISGSRRYRTCAAKRTQR